MPISTPAEIAKLFNGDLDHFKHVLECLIVPAVKTAGFQPIPPTAAGSEIIQANIIKNLSDADMVLCDLSTLNANVFYELGIRTSLNKPVTLICDEYVPKIPFDTSIINVMKYTGSMPAWQLDREKLEISDHIKATAEKSNGKNPMWQYFGIPQAASLPAASEASATQVLEIILSKIQALEKRMPAELSEAEAMRRAMAHGAVTAPISGSWWDPSRASDSLVTDYSRVFKALGELGKPSIYTQPTTLEGTVTAPDDKKLPQISD